MSHASLHKIFYAQYRADCLTVKAFIVIPSNEARIKVQLANAVREVRIKRTTPVKTERTHSVQNRIDAVARRWQENTIAVYLTCYFITIYTIL